MLNFTLTAMGDSLVQPNLDQNGLYMAYHIK